MSHAAVQLFRPYLSGWLSARIGSAGLQPGQLHVGEATVLYADLSGFTRLAAAFAALPDGAERLHDSLSRSFDALVSTVVAHGGDVVAIAGDALTAWWPEVVDQTVARRCGAAMQAALSGLPTIDTPAGPFRPELRIGVSAGAAYAALAGLPSHGIHLVVFGPAVAAASAAERLAAPGSVFALEPPAAPALAVAAPGSADGPTLDYEDFLPPAFVERLRLNALVPEYRRCVPAFCSFVLPRRPDQLHRLVAQVQAVTTRWGGWLNEVEVGDKGAVFVLLFGAPVARGDDTSRAVGCCMELRDRGLIAKAGITVGILFVGPVGSAQRRVYTAQGDDMNLAAHLMERAEPGHILVSGRVRADILGRYQVSPPTLTVTKGHSEGVPVSRVLAANDQGARVEGSQRRYLPGTAALVGREAERRAIEEASRAAAAGRPQLLLLEGESGIGKSTMLQNLSARWVGRGQRALSGECLSGASDQPLAPWRGILLDICGIDESASPRLQRSRLSQAARGLPEARAGTPPLARLLRVGAGRAEAPDPASLGPALALALALLRRALAAGPLLVTLEDIHWADPASLRLTSDLIDAAEADAAPLLLACSLRPLDTGAPPALAALAERPGAARLSLRPLAAAEGQALLRLLLGVSHVQPALAQHIERHTEGQPLFITEYLRALRQNDLIQIEDGIARLARPLVAVQVSSSAQGIIQARVDRLDEPTRLTLKVAAVIGRSFPLRLLATVHPASPGIDRLSEQLEVLTQLQIVDLELGDPERVYRFKHGITHEVAYTSLLFGQRRELHAAVAAWYAAEYAAEIAAGNVAMAVYDVLIDHLRRADLWDQAARHCQQAAEQAAKSAGFNAALRYIEQALVLGGDAAHRRSLLLLRLAIHDQIGVYASQADDLAALDRLPVGVVDPHGAALATIFRARHLLAAAQPAAALDLGPPLLRELRQLARRDLAASQLLRAAWLNVQGVARADMGALARGRDLQRRALALCTLAQAQRGLQRPWPPQALAARCLSDLGAAVLLLGEPAQALRHQRRALELAAAAGDWCGEARARAGMARALRQLGQNEEARAAVAAALSTSQAVGDQGAQVAALRERAALSAERGELAEAQRLAWHALAISTRAQDRTRELLILADLAAYATAEGQDEEAEAARQESRKIMAGS